VLPKLVGARLAAGDPGGPYASWDVEGEGLLSIFDRTAMNAVTGVNTTAGGTVMLVCRVTDVDAGTELCLTNGATLVVPPADRPEWGPNLRTSHLRALEGVLIELQSY
jgi:hypothetical protein